MSCQTVHETQLPPNKLIVFQETRAVFQKLHKFIGKAIKHLVERTDEDYVFRLHKNRVYYVRESLMRRATNVSASGQVLAAVYSLGTAAPASTMSLGCAGGSREAGAPGHEHREDDPQRQVPPHSGLLGPARTAC